MTETTPDLPVDDPETGDQDAEPSTTPEEIERDSERDQAEGEPGQADD